MRLTVTLLGIFVVFFASYDNLAVASIKNTKNGFYADLYNIEDGVVTDKMLVPLGKVVDYKPSDIKKLKSSLTSQEERAAVYLPRGVDTFLKGLSKFVGLFRRGGRRLRIEQA
ncbi:hypothetical protein PHMEG_0007740 [Phytophthora megakarya]|uniref:RxLR effector protein n=1 Tax=Phytophthora megakarya TaxID=4795 RepID=A0A225WKF7_9STRA|nr:hypothetical protein PHMEG_0007740 [Phytophthora megakarya]